MLKEIANVTGVSNVSQWPKNIIVGEQRLTAYNTAAFLEAKTLLLQGVANVTGISEEAIFPVKVDVVSGRGRPRRMDINHAYDMLASFGRSLGYRKDDIFPIELKFGDRDSGGEQKFWYGDIGAFNVDSFKAIAPHKILYGNGNKGYGMPAEQLIPGATGNDFTKDLPGIFTRQFSAIQRYGFDSPIAIEFGLSPEQVEQLQEQNIPDSEVSKTGLQVNSLGGAIQALIYLGLETGEDIDSQTNFLLRLAYMLSRTNQLLVRVWGKVTTILDGLGVPVKTIRQVESLEFNPFANKTFKGFDRTQRGEIDLGDDDVTEKLINKVLKTTETTIPISASDKAKSTIYEKLIEITARKS